MKHVCKWWFNQTASEVKLPVVGWDIKRSMRVSFTSFVLLFWFQGGFCLGCIAFNIIFRCQCWTSVKSMYMVSCCISLIKIKFAFYLRKCCKIFNESIFAGTTHADGILTVRMGSDVTRFSSSIAGISLCGSSDQEIPHPGLIRTTHHLSLLMRKHLACWSPSARTCMRNL